MPITEGEYQAYPVRIHTTNAKQMRKSFLVQPEDYPTGLTLSDNFQLYRIVVTGGQYMEILEVPGLKFDSEGFYKSGVKGIDFIYDLKRNNRLLMSTLIATDNPNLVDFSMEVEPQILTRKVDFIGRHRDNPRLTYLEVRKKGVERFLP